MEMEEESMLEVEMEEESILKTSPDCEQDFISNLAAEIALAQLEIITSDDNDDNNKDLGDLEKYIDYVTVSDINPAEQIQQKMLFEFDSKPKEQSNVKSSFAVSKESKLAGKASIYGKYDCTVCGKVFKFKPSADNHMRTVHEGLPSKFSSKIPGRFECTYQGCSRFYKHKWDTENHIRTVHEGQEIKCGVCKKKFTKNSNKLAHMRKNCLGNR